MNRAGCLIVCLRLLAVVGRSGSRRHGGQTSHPGQGCHPDADWTVIPAQAVIPVQAVIPTQAGIHGGAGCRKSSRDVGLPASRQALPGGGSHWGGLR